jgi:acyl-CoA synthetase (NDP forming)
MRDVRREHHPSSLATHPSPLDRMFRPRSVAVVGASQNPSFVSGIFKNLLRYSYEGTVSAINPRYESILGAPCYGSVLDVPGPLDLVVIGVASRLIPTVLEQCEEKDVGAVEIVSSGFSEMGGAEGAQRQAELAGWARRTGIPVGGPNCLGLMNMTIGMMALPTTLERLIPGKVGAVLQSGMMAPSIIVPLLAREIGFTIGVTTGNEVDLEAADYVRYCVEDDETRVIACYTEQIKTPAKFIAACTLAAERNKPVIMLKIGRSEIAQRSALAHTGSLVGADDVTDAVLRKLGVIRVDTVDDLYEAVAIFHTRKLPRGGGVVPVSVSGGAGGLLADLAQEIGVEFPPLPQQTAEALRTIVPEYGNVGNPLDITGQGVFETDMVRAAFDQLATAGNLDIVVWARSFPSNLDRQSPVGQILEQAVEKYPEIVFLVMALVSGHFYPQVYPDQPLAEPINHLDGIPFLQGSESGLKAIAALIRYAEWQRERAAGMAPPPGPLHDSYHGAPDPHGPAAGEGGQDRGRGAGAGAGARGWWACADRAREQGYSGALRHPHHPRDPGGRLGARGRGGSGDRVPGRAEGRVAGAAPQDRSWRDHAERHGRGDPPSRLQACADERLVGGPGLLRQRRAGPGDDPERHRNDRRDEPRCAVRAGDRLRTGGHFRRDAEGRPAPAAAALRRRGPAGARAAARLPSLARHPRIGPGRPGRAGGRAAALLGAVPRSWGYRPGDRRQPADRDERFGLCCGLFGRAGW